jgi:glyoxylase-like metal-dependent hydrolase (beta-lactamase superfamily II)
MTLRSASIRLATVLLAVATYAYPSRVFAQANPYSAALLARIRTAARAIPGPRPRELRYIAIGEAHPPLSFLLAGADTQRVTSIIPAFQIRFADRWIMVDAALDSTAIVQYYGSMAGTAYSKSRYDSLQLALRAADAIVLTHEHFDHANGVQRSSYFKEVAPKTLLTSAQRQSLLHPPTRAFFPMSADSASGFGAVEYDLVHALAPGVVLIKAPGHSPGSQFVYVRLADGHEILLVGDLVWMMAGLTMNHQKPQAASDDLTEDRAAVQLQMDWVRSVMSSDSVAVVAGHDKQWLDTLVGRGLLHVGLDLH